MWQRSWIQLQLICYCKHFLEQKCKKGKEKNHMNACMAFQQFLKKSPEILKDSKFNFKFCIDGAIHKNFWWFDIAKDMRFLTCRRPKQSIFGWWIRSIYRVGCDLLWWTYAISKIRRQWLPRESYSDINRNTVILLSKAIILF